MELGNRSFVRPHLSGLADIFVLGLQPVRQGIAVRPTTPYDPLYVLEHCLGRCMALAMAMANMQAFWYTCSQDERNATLPKVRT